MLTTQIILWNYTDIPTIKQFRSTAVRQIRKMVAIKFYDILIWDPSVQLQQSFKIRSYKSVMKNFWIAHRDHSEYCVRLRSNYQEETEAQ